MEAIEGFVTEIEGERRIVTVGQRFYADHPVVVAHAIFFQPLGLHPPVAQSEYIAATRA